MRDRKSPVILTPGDCASHTVHTTHVHHRDFPELWEEGHSPEEALTLLSQRLARDLEHIGSTWHSDAIRRAIVDVEEFLAALAGPALAEPPARGR